MIEVHERLNNLIRQIVTLNNLGCCLHNLITTGICNGGEVLE